MPISQATVDSLSIEVKAIRIDGRKMTIAVFQQLPQIRILLDAKGMDPSVRPDINPWGYVRHKIKDEGILWLISECRGELCRSTLHIVDEREYSDAADKVLSRYRAKILAEHDQLFIAT